MKWRKPFNYVVGAAAMIAVAVKAGNGQDAYGLAMTLLACFCGANAVWSIGAAASGSFFSNFSRFLNWCYGAVTLFYLAEWRNIFLYDKSWITLVQFGAGFCILNAFLSIADAAIAKPPSEP